MGFALQSIQDIIESGFDISTTTLPKDRLHKPGGMYDKKVKDGYEVLEQRKATGSRLSSPRQSPNGEATAKDDDLNEFKLSNDDDEEDDDEDLPEDPQKR